MFCCTLLYVHSSIAVILMGKRGLVALLNLSAWCLVMVGRLLLAVPRGCLRFVIVVYCLILLTYYFQREVSDILWQISKRVGVRRSYRNRLRKYLSQIKPHMFTISELSKEKSQRFDICSGCASLRQSQLSSLINNKNTIIQQHFYQI